MGKHLRKASKKLDIRRIARENTVGKDEDKMAAYKKPGSMKL